MLDADGIGKLSVFLAAVAGIFAYVLKPWKWFKAWADRRTANAVMLAQIAMRLDEMDKRFDKLERKVDITLNTGLDMARGLGWNRRHTDPVRVMCVDDDDAFAMLIGVRLEPCEFVVSYRVESTVEAAAVRGIDIILLDLDLGYISGLDTLRRMAELAPHAPILVLTSSDEMGAIAKQTGLASEFLSKNAAVIPGALETRIQMALVRNPHAPERPPEGDMK